MKIVCSYCNKDMGEKDPFDDKQLTHGICPECDIYFAKQIEGLPLGEYLEYLEFPAIIFNKDIRVIAINKAAEKLTGRSSEETIGLIGGEAMECSYARLPEGCGNTVHCETCTIRRTFMSVMETGKSEEHVLVNLRQDLQEVHIVISVKKIKDVVQMVVEETEIKSHSSI